MAHPDGIEVVPQRSASDLDLSLTSDLLRSSSNSPQRQPPPSAPAFRSTQFFPDGDKNNNDNNHQLASVVDTNMNLSQQVGSLPGSMDEDIPALSQAPKQSEPGPDPASEVTESSPTPAPPLEPKLPPLRPNAVHPMPQPTHPEDEAGSTMSDLLNMLECPICLDTADRPPIYQCPEGHLICEDCNSRLMDCPQCGHALMNSRNRTAEELAAKLQALRGNRRSEMMPSQHIQISVSEPQKVRKGLFANVVYHIKTKVSARPGEEGGPDSTYSVSRKYSEIVHLYEKLLRIHHKTGVIVPPPPEKNRLATIVVKLSNGTSLEDSAASHVFEKRCLALDRYMKRLAKHPVIRKDPNFRAFIQEKDVPKSLRESKSLNETMTDLKEKLHLFRTKFTVTEHDPWYQTRHAQLTTLTKQVREMQSNLKHMADLKKKLADTSTDFQRGLMAMLVNRPSRENGLGNIINEVVDCHKTMGLINQEQSQADELIVQLAVDYEKLVSAAKDVMALRRKYQQQMQKAQKGKNSLDEIEKIQKEFDKMSQIIRRELEHFDFVMREEFEETFTAYNSRYWQSLSQTKTKRH